MPRLLELKLRREAKTKDLGKKRTNAYVYGSLRKTEWKPRKKKR